MVGRTLCSVERHQLAVILLLCADRSVGVCVCVLTFLWRDMYKTTRREAERTIRQTEYLIALLGLVFLVYLYSVLPGKEA